MNGIIKRIIFNKNVEFISLFVITLAGANAALGSINLLQRLIVLISVSLVSEYIITKMFKTDTDFDLNSVSIALLIFLLTDVKSNLILSLFALIFAQFFGRLISLNGYPLFNSTTIGLFIFSLFGLKTTWWGLNAGTIVTLLVIIFGTLTNFLKNNLRSVLIFFLLTVSINFILTINPLYSIKQLFVPGYLFFAYFILLRNKSALVGFKTRWIYITSTSLLAVIIPKFGFFTDPLITSLVIADFLLLSLRMFLPESIQRFNS